MFCASAVLRFTGVDAALGLVILFMSVSTILLIAWLEFLFATITDSDQSLFGVFPGLICVSSELHGMSFLDMSLNTVFLHSQLPAP